MSMSYFFLYCPYCILDTRVLIIISAPLFFFSTQTKENMTIQKYDTKIYDCLNDRNACESVFTYRNTTSIL